MKAIKQVMRQDRESYRVPRRVQDVIHIQRIWSDGIFLVGNRYAKTFKFTDINYMVASQESQTICARWRCFGISSWMA